MSNIEQFLREFNEAWAREDSAAILDAVTDDIRFRMANEDGIQGKEAFGKFLKEMEGSAQGFELNIANVIVDGDRAAVDGRMQFTDNTGKRMVCAFCDVYSLRGGPSPKISALTAYVMEQKAQ